MIHSASGDIFQKNQSFYVIGQSVENSKRTIDYYLLRAFIYSFKLHSFDKYDNFLQMIYKEIVLNLYYTTTIWWACYISCNI